MRKIDNQITLSKKEKADIRLMLNHAARDIAFGEGGSYGNTTTSAEWKAALKEMKRAESAIHTIQILLNEYL